MPYYDPDEKTIYLAHSCIALRLPVRIDWRQVRLTLGITYPRHRRLLKAKLGPLGRFLPYREWNEDETGFVSVWSEEEADALWERRYEAWKTHLQDRLDEIKGDDRAVIQAPKESSC